MQINTELINLYIWYNNNNISNNNNEDYYKKNTSTTTHIFKTQHIHTHTHNATDVFMRSFLDRKT